MDAVSARSIVLHDVGYRPRNAPAVLDGLALALPADRRVAVLGRAESGKTTLIQLLCGLIEPTSGRIERQARLSFPVGFQAGLRPLLTLRDNAAYVADLYGADPAEVIAFVEAVAGLGEHWNARLRRTPTAERVRFAYALSYAIPFDSYLIDGLPGGGVPEFRAVCDALLEARSREAGYILATRHERVAQRYCDAAYVLHGGRLHAFDTMDQACAAFRSIQDPEVSTAADLPPNAESADDED